MRWFPTLPRFSAIWEPPVRVCGDKSDQIRREASGQIDARHRRKRRFSTKGNASAKSTQVSTHKRWGWGVVLFRLDVPIRDTRRREREGDKGRASGESEAILAERSEAPMRCAQWRWAMGWAGVGRWLAWQGRRDGRWFSSVCSEHRGGRISRVRGVRDVKLRDGGAEVELRQRVAASPGGFPAKSRPGGEPPTHVQIRFISHPWIFSHLAL